MLRVMAYVFSAFSPLAICRLRRFHIVSYLDGYGFFFFLDPGYFCITINNLELLVAWNQFLLGLTFMIY